MPLLTSPIDGSPMRQINRFGIEIDVCPTSGGVWLDRGELEKLMALLKEEAAAESAQYAPRQAQGHQPGWDDDDYRRGKDSHYDKRPYKQKSTASRVMDIFDF